ncbi:MAG: hypothetical protein D3903_18605 [Candidatus Electrothrix sp. GM3_4]|nr:hypothetical protein [Candidatus Electrothrix sp. GM3_4]
MSHIPEGSRKVMLANIREGSRKVILTKWMLIIFSLGTLGYYLLLAKSGEAPPASFFMNFVLGLGAIGGAFTVGNIFEHKAQSDQKIEELRHSDNGMKRAQAQAQIQQVQQFPK